MKAIRIHQVDAFTDVLFGGNPTAVVLDADHLNDQDMRNLAREMNLSESTFVLKSDEADFRLRYFTPPGDEIKFCGHATVGALATISRLGLYGAAPGQQKQLSFQTNAGVLNADLIYPDVVDPIIIFDATHVDLVEAHYELESVRAALDIPREYIDWSRPLMLEKTNNYVYFTINNLSQLEKINLDVRGAIDFAKEDRIVVFCALTTETVDKGNHVHARGYAPLVGVPEDPFTGSMQGGLAGYLVANDMVSTELSFIGSEQGHFIGRPGHVKIELIRGEQFKARLHARAVHVFSTEMNLP